MDLQWECNRLSKDELEYELKIRGFEDVGTVDKMRSCLRNVLKLERSGQSLTYPAYALNCDEEFKIVEDKIKEIVSSIEIFEGDDKTTAYKKISSKIAHVMKRIDRTNPTESDKIKLRSSLLSQALTLMPKLKFRIKNLKFQEASILNPSFFNIDLEDDLSSEEETAAHGNICNSTPKNKTSHTTEFSALHPKSIPVTKWNLQFSGDSKDMSVLAFLERVDELSVSRHIGEQELFESAFDLFRGSALTWFRANKKKFNNWNDIGMALKKQFLPHDYDDRLFEEIKKRTQGENENIGIYVACMTTLFSRLSYNVPESVQLRLVLRNILPFFQLHLGLIEVDSLDHLIDLCSKLEIKKHSVENFSKPLRRKTDLEPDLAYVEASSSSSHMGSQVSSVTCWNCRKLGHTSRVCRATKTKHCYKCGFPGVTVRDCKTCSRTTAMSENN